MMRQLYLIQFALLSFIYTQAQDALNVELFTQFHRGDDRYSGCWVYLAPDGSEYALLGTKTGTAIYIIDDQNAIEEVAFIPGGSSNWREIIVVGDHAYVTTESSAADVGMQVIDLTDLPNSASLLTTYTETFTRGHIIQKDIFSDAPFVYVNGTTTTEGVHMLDVSDPANPLEVGLYNPGYYIHDCFVKDTLLFAAAFYEGTMDVVSISDKANPVVLARIPTPGGRTHSSSISSDGNYLFIAPELDGLLGSIWNIEDFDNPTMVATYTANLESLVHNPYVLGDFAYISHNTEGLRIVDFTDPELPVEVGFFDTYPGESGGFSGLWSACPYLPSGKIIGGNRENGLYVWTFNETRAARAYGLVRDSVSQEPIFNASILIPETGQDLNSGLEGRFKFGNFAGSYTFEVEAEGYVGKSVTLDMAEGSQEQLVFDLVPEMVSSTSNTWIQQIQVYPNPFKGELSIDFGNTIFTGNILLRDATGQMSQNHQVKDSNSSLQLNFGALPAGNYWLDFLDENGQLKGTYPIISQ